MMLSACSVTGQTPAEYVAAAIAAVQDAAKLTCQFLPYEQTITGLIGLNDPTLQTAQQIADAICASVKSSSAIAGQRPRVKGVAVRGRFVRQ